MIYLYIMIVVEIALILLMYVNNKGDIMAPSLISMLTFFVATICIIINRDFWQVKYNANTFFIVLAGFSMIYLADVCITMARNRKYVKSVLPEDSSNYYYYELRRGWIIVLYVIMSLDLIIMIYELRSMGRSLGASGLQIIGIVKESELRFDFIGRIAYQSLNIFSVVILFIIAFNAGNEKYSKKNDIKLYPLALIGFVAMYITGQRSLLIRALFFFMAIFAISLRRNRKDSTKNTKELIRRMAIPLVVVIAVFYGSRVIVKGIGGWSANKGPLEYITYYIGSPLYLFDTYVQNPSYISPGSPYFGGFTFADFYATLYRIGLVEKPVDKFHFAPVGGMTSYGGNEYSLFMRPMEDFSIVGMLIFVFVLYYVFSRVYYTKIKHKKVTRIWTNTVVVYSYFFYIIPMAFYYPFTVQESKPMNIIYLIIILVCIKYITKRKASLEER